MKRGLMAIASIAVFVATAHASPPPITPRTVVAKVQSYEHYRAFGTTGRFSQETPYGNENAIVATILSPEKLAGREIAIPFESEDARRELLVQPGTVFRFEHRMNLADLSAKTDMLRRRGIEFPAFGILVLKPDGEVAFSYPGALTALREEQEKKTAAGHR